MLIVHPQPSPYLLPDVYLVNCSIQNNNKNVVNIGEINPNLVCCLLCFRFFTKMPSEHYMIEAKLILATAPEDVPRCEEIRTSIKDIWDIRTAKLRTSMDDFIKGEGTYAKLDYLTTMEIHSVRPLLPHSLDFIARLEHVRPRIPI